MNAYSIISSLAIIIKKNWRFYHEKIKVGVAGCGVIEQRLADVVALQGDMELVVTYPWHRGRMKGWRANMNDHREVLSKLISDNKLDPQITLFNISTYKHGDIFLDHIHKKPDRTDVCILWDFLYEGKRVLY